MLSRRKNAFSKRIRTLSRIKKIFEKHKYDVFKIKVHSRIKKGFMNKKDAIKTKGHFQEDFINKNDVYKCK